MFYYRTFISNNFETQLTIEDLYNGITIPQTKESTVKTIRVSEIPTRWYNDANDINTKLTHLLQLYPSVDIAYTEYRIPKQKGGYRLISAPSDELKKLQSDLHKFFVHHGAFAHNDAYAYVSHRTCKDALIRHKVQSTNYFYKFDLHDFFPSCTCALLKQQLKQIYPFCMLTEDLLNEVINIATYKDALPQGSPLSPLLSNMVLLPFDWAMHYSIRHFAGVYTRYADDLQISFFSKKQLHFLEHIITGHLPDGLELNTEKSRCGSIAGHNINLGLVLNKDRNITLGHKKKMELKAKLNNFIFDFTNQRYWSIIDTQVLQGELNYFKQIEPEYAAFVIRRLENKHHTNKSISLMFADIVAERV